MKIAYISASIFFAYFCKYVNWESGKKWVFLSISQGIIREFFFRELGVEPVILLTFKIVDKHCSH